MQVHVLDLFHYHVILDILLVLVSVLLVDQMQLLVHQILSH